MDADVALLQEAAAPPPAYLRLGEQPAGLGDGDLRGLALDRPVALAAHREVFGAQVVEVLADVPSARCARASGRAARNERGQVRRRWERSGAGNEGLGWSDVLGHECVSLVNDNILYHA